MIHRLRLSVVVSLLPLLVFAPAARGEARVGNAGVVTPAIVVAADDPQVRYVGRWGRLGNTLATVNSGSRILLRFTGRHITATFDQSTVTHPPQVYVRIDGSRPVLYTVDSDRLHLTARPLPAGRVHTLEIAVKDVDERANRWNPPLRSGLLLTGFRLDRGAHALTPPAASGRRVEFLGDSITQGVRAIGPEIGVDGSDATKAYAWLTGTALGADFRQVGFGAQGILQPGGGEVPPAVKALGFNFAGSPIDTTDPPQAVVVNQGTNDALNARDPTAFQAAYLDYLRRIRTAWPGAWMFAIRPFGGYLGREIAAAVTAAADDRIVYVDTTGWLAPTDFTDGLHPTYAGHLRVARRLVPIVARRLGWSAGTVPEPRVSLLAAGAGAGFESAGDLGWVPGANVEAVRIDDQTAALPYDGRAALQATSTVAPLTQWRTVTLRPGSRVPLPGGARDLFVYVSPIIAALTLYDARLTVTQGRHTYVDEAYGLPHLGFIPWNRLHVNLPSEAPVTGISVSVRVAADADRGRLSFQIDDVGWTDVRDG